MVTTTERIAWLNIRIIAIVRATVTLPLAGRPLPAENDPYVYAAAWRVVKGK